MTVQDARVLLASYECAVSYLRSNDTIVSARAEAIRRRDEGAAQMPAALRDAIEHCDALLASMKALLDERGIYHTDESVEAAREAVAKAEGR